MPEGRTRSGSIAEFRVSWRERRESVYNHWIRGTPRNQVQLAFRCHWEVFSRKLGARPPGRSLEVGCGRGSLSSYFADNGWQATLLDSSPEVLAIAGGIFERNGHAATFVAGDANSLPFDDEDFDAVASIGLLEHFEDPSQAIVEQWRVLRPGGWLFAYIVPERPDNVQRYFNWVNTLLKMTVGRMQGEGKGAAKQQLYRSDSGSAAYLPIFERLSPAETFVAGMYPLPLVSHSPEFPFSLLPVPMERVLVALFRLTISVRTILFRRHGWLCSERMGQAFLIAARKRERA